MRRTVATMVTLMVGAAIVAFAPAAAAQTGYPSGLCPPTDTVFDAGTHNVTGTFTVRLAPVCLWTPVSEVVTPLNGQPVGPKVADAAGGVLVASRCGENNASGIGPSAAAGGAMVRSAASFRVNCDRAAAPRSGRVGIVAFTGADVMRWGGLALGLLAVGSLLVIGTRRRRTAGGA